MNKRWTAVMPAGVLVVAALEIAACGGNQTRQAATGAPADNGVDAAMVAHHQSAVEMAKIARRRATTQFVKRPADDVIARQTSEVTKMRVIRRDLPRAVVGGLGVDTSDMGMAMSPSMLRSARPFDRECVDVIGPTTRAPSAWLASSWTRGPTRSFVALPTPSSPPRHARSRR